MSFHFGVASAFIIRALSSWLLNLMSIWETLCSPWFLSVFGNLQKWMWFWFILYFLPCKHCAPVLISQNTPWSQFSKLCSNNLQQYLFMLWKGFYTCAVIYEFISFSKFLFLHFKYNWQLFCEILFSKIVSFIFFYQQTSWHTNNHISDVKTTCLHAAF